MTARRVLISGGTSGIGYAFAERRAAARPGGTPFLHDESTRAEPLARIPAGRFGASRRSRPWWTSYSAQTPRT